jgi:hypothetical protein
VPFEKLSQSEMITPFMAPLSLLKGSIGNSPFQFSLADLYSVLVVSNIMKKKTEEGKNFGLVGMYSVWEV